jgi:hypothetical protein
MAVFAGVCLAVAWFGYNAGTERYISPERGIGYSLGIVGGSAMLLLLLYPARKRARWLGFLGSVKGWFQAHMLLGLLGPLIILFHSNFRLGATNSNVALYSMLVVSISGLFGRYFYGRIHVEFYGHQSSFADLRANLERMRQEATDVPYQSELAMRLKVGVLGMTSGLDAVPMLLRPPVIALRSFVLRFRLARFIRRQVHDSAASRGLDARARKLELRAGRDLVDAYVDAARKVVEFEAYERLFSLWHLLHLPLFFMLLAAGIVHVVAVHIY